MAITETELKVMAALARIGLSNKAEKRIEHAGGNRDTQRIVEKREREILADVAHRCAAQSAGPGDAAQVAGEQRDSRALDGDVRSRAHGDADISLRESRCIVHSVACHGDNVTFGLQSLDHGAFLIGQHSGDYFVNAQGASDGFGGRAACLRSA